MPRKRKEEVTIEPGQGLNLDPELINQLVPGIEVLPDFISTVTDASP